MSEAISVPFQRTRDEPEDDPLPPDDGRERQLSEDVVFEIMSNRRRRYLLYYLKQTDDGAAEIYDISKQIAAWERTISTEEVPYGDRKNVHTSLRQFHLPKMNDAGFINYDRQSSRVELTRQANETDVRIETPSDDGPHRNIHIAAISGLVTMIAAAVWLDDGLLLGLSDGDWTVLVAVAIVIISAIYVREL